MHRICALAAAATVHAISVAAVACSLYWSEPWYGNELEQGIDTTAPTAPTIVNVSIIRADEQNGGACDHALCSPVSQLEIEFEPGTDDRTPEDELGYQFEVVVGDWLSFPVETTKPFSSGYYFIYFQDRDQSAAVEFAFRMRAVDLAGNVGPWTPVVDISHPGVGGCLCNAPPRGSASPWSNVGPIVGALLFVRSRRRRRPPTTPTYNAAPALPPRAGAKHARLGGVGGEPAPEAPALPPHTIDL